MFEICHLRRFPLCPDSRPVAGIKSDRDYCALGSPRLPEGSCFLVSFIVKWLQLVNYYLFQYHQAITMSISILIRVTFGQEKLEGFIILTRISSIYPVNGGQSEKGWIHTRMGETTKKIHPAGKILRLYVVFVWFSVSECARKLQLIYRMIPLLKWLQVQLCTRTSGCMFLSVNYFFKLLTAAEYFQRARVY